MTKAELIKALEKYDDDMVVRFTLECDNSYRNIDAIQERGKAGIILKSYDIPDGDDLYSMANACLDNPNNTLTKSEEEKLMEFATL